MRIYIYIYIYIGGANPPRWLDGCVGCRLLGGERHQGTGCGNLPGDIYIIICIKVYYMMIHILCILAGPILAGWMNVRLLGGEQH